MKIDARYIVAGLLLLFAWKGEAIDMTWPPPDSAPVTPEPSQDKKAWASGVKPVAATMLPADREYLASFYEAMAFVLLRDGDRSEPIISSTPKFVDFHAGSLKLAIDKNKVGAYPGLDKAIDAAFFQAVGTDDPVEVTPDVRGRLVAACGVLSYTFRVGRDG